MKENSTITLRIIDGIDQGRYFESLTLPVGIGREAQNTIQLRDEKVSRYHCRIFEEEGEILLADLESTNGTLLNGQPVSVQRVFPGHLIALGQTLIIVGSRKEIAQRLACLDDLSMEDAALRMLAAGNHPEFLPESVVSEMELYSYDAADALRRLHGIQPPELPKGMSAPQTAQLMEILLYLRLRMKLLIENARQNEITDRVSLEPRDWQGFLDLFSRISDYGLGLTSREE
ncbi:MAG: FHA domain-containing protein [Thermoguttaceae bacterium]|nr:FHA domain-containing protein [Thermoguttaceae bacterium]